MEEWKKEMDGMSTLWMYRKYKEKIAYEDCYDNSEGSRILVRARTSCMKLGEWEMRGERSSPIEYEK